MITKINTILKPLFIFSIILLISGTIYYGINTLKHHSSYISTNGLSVRHVTSDFAIWDVKIIAEANTPKEALERLQKDKISTIQFLANLGFSPDEISEEPVIINDNFEYYNAHDSNKPRFSAVAAFCIQSKNLEIIKKSALKISQLMAQNIRVGSNIRYLYKDLDKLKIEMIKEATQDSKNRAEKIADSLKIKLQGVKNIHTGAFSIIPEDASVLSGNGWDEGENSIKKRIRVVVHGTFSIK